MLLLHFFNKVQANSREKDAVQRNGASGGNLPLLTLLALLGLELVSSEHGGFSNVRDGGVASVAAHAGGVVAIAGSLGQHPDHAGGEGRHHGQVQVAALAIDDDGHGGGGDELDVGLFAVKFLAPVVDLDASHNGVVGLRGVHSLGDEVLQVLQTSRGGCTCERPFA